QGSFALSAGLQLDRERDGSRTWFTLNQFEYAVTDHIELLIEPFFYQWTKPKEDAAYEGVGDLEITPSWKVVDEDEAVPALVLAFKLKVPTASNRNIGTGKYDYQPYVIVGKTFGSWIVNANFG